MNNMSDQAIKINSLELNMKQVQKDISEIKDDYKEFKKDFGDFKDHLEDNFVTRKEFTPIQKIVYGLMGTIATVILSALIYNIIK